MKNNYPKKIKVGPYNYTVELYPNSEYSDHGACVYTHQTIFLNHNQHPERAGDTLLHEVLHAIWDLSGFDQVAELNEENIVRSMATWLSLTLKENPKLVDFIINPNENWIPDYSQKALEEASGE
jgi:hypothetical protein